jgi:hypothetical protein
LGLFALICRIASISGRYRVRQKRYPEFVVNSYGRLTLDRPHQVKVQAAYVFPFNVTASVSGYYLSGTPLSKIG